MAKAHEMGWPSVATMVLVFDCIGQSPTDVRNLQRKAYDGTSLDVTRAKTGVGDAPILLFPEVKRALDEYLANAARTAP